MKKIKLIILIIVMISIVSSCIAYTLPRTIEQRYPYIDLSQCIEINGYCFTAFGEEDQTYSIKSSDTDFSELIDLIKNAKFRVRLSNLLQQGAKTHNYSDGDYTWDVFLSFDEVILPDGSTISGEVFHVKNFFGQLMYAFNGDVLQCSVNSQDQWTQNIMNIISKHVIN